MANRSDWLPGRTSRSSEGEWAGCVCAHSVRGECTGCWCCCGGNEDLDDDFYLSEPVKRTYDADELGIDQEDD